MMSHISVIGEGAWGTAISTLLAHNGYTVKLWCFDKEQAACIEQTRINERYLPDIHLSERIQPVTDLQNSICGAEWIFEAIPVQISSLYSYTGKNIGYTGAEMGGIKQGN